MAFPSTRNSKLFLSIVRILGFSWRISFLFLFFSLDGCIFIQFPYLDESLMLIQSYTIASNAMATFSFCLVPFNSLFHSVIILVVVVAFFTFTFVICKCESFDTGIKLSLFFFSILCPDEMTSQCECCCLCFCSVCVCTFFC